MKLFTRPASWDGVVVSKDLGQPNPVSPSELMAIKGKMLSVGEVRLLKKLAFWTHPNKVVINIGAGAGTSAMAFLEANRSLNVYTVDISLDNLKAEALALAAAGLPATIQLHQNSAQAGRDWKMGEVAILFIDGNHSARAVRADIEAWLPHVEDGGIVVFHDYGVGHPGWADVYQVVNEWRGAKPIVGRERLLIAFKINHEP